MSERPDEGTRKRLKKQASEQQRREWEQQLPLALAQHQELLDHLDQWLGRNTCDHTMRETRRWAHEKGLDPDKVEDGYVEMAAGCDCEVLANLDPQARVF